MAISPKDALTRLRRARRAAGLQRSRDRDLARTPSLGSLRLQAVAAVVAALAGAMALYLFLAWLLGVTPHPLAAAGQQKLPIGDQQRLLADLVKIALGLAAGIGAAVALVVGYRRARVEEASSHRDDRRLFSSRYQDAADLIGSDKAAVRLAGIYAMARLADDWAEQRQQCIDVLCAYLRLPYDPAASEPGEREVRLTVIRIVTAHLQPFAPRSWQGHDLDFTGAVFDGGDFSGAQFSAGTIDFRGARFAGGDVTFQAARFSGGTVDFRAARFSGSDVTFNAAQFSGSSVNFNNSGFSAGTVDFTYTQFSGGTVTFSSAEFSGGKVDFSGAEFAGGNVGFSNARFVGGTVTFRGAGFSGSGIYFRDTKFSGSAVDFSAADFSGGAATFKGADFSGGTVTFRGAEFSGCEVDLSSTDRADGGTAPQGLPDAPIASLKLPGWMKQTSPDGLPPR